MEAITVSIKFDFVKGDQQIKVAIVVEFSSFRRYFVFPGIISLFSSLLAILSSFFNTIKQA